MNSHIGFIIQPEVLRWARDTSGLTIAEVARKLKKSEQDVLDWESGITIPSYSQLEKLAYELYKRPLAVFFLPKPPQEENQKHEFRTLPQADLENLMPDTISHIKDAHAYQLDLDDLFNNRNPERRPIFHKIDLHPEESIELQANEVRLMLNASIESRSVCDSDEDALKFWIKNIEKQGVFVFKSSFKQKEISGFSLNHEEFPIIYINNSTTKTRQIFSLLHELAHILLGMNGISKFEDSYIKYLGSKEQAIEIFCNKFASELLIPDADFNKQIQRIDSIEIDEIESILYPLTKRYCVSREAILRRFLDKEMVSKQIYEKKVKDWNGQIKSSGQGNWYSTKNAYLSARFAREVLTKHYNKSLSIEQASDYLGIKPKNFAGLEQKILMSAK